MGRNRIKLDLKSGRRAGKMPIGAASIRSTSLMRSARHKVGTCVSDTRETNGRMRVNRYESIVQRSNGGISAHQFLSPPRSLAPLTLRN